MDAAAVAAAKARREIISRLVLVAEHYFDTPEGSIQNPARRNGRISRARWAVSHVLADTCGWSEPKIAILLNCDPSSINTGKKRARELLQSDGIFFEGVSELQKVVAP